MSLEYLGRDATGEAALHFNLNMRVPGAKQRNQRQQAHHRVFICAQRQFSTMQIAQLAYSRVSVPAQIQHLLREVMKHPPGGRQCSIFRRTIEQRLAEFVFQPANCLAYGRLRSMQRLSRTRKTFLARNAQKHFQLIEIHLSFVL